MSNSKLKAAVIGLGMGKNHVRGFRSHPGCEVVAVADNNVQRLKERGDEYGVKGQYADYKEMLQKEKPDIVAIATPNFLHKPMTVDAIKAGAHVLCEKPMSMNAEEAREMQAAADKAGKKLMINFSYRFRPQAWAMKQQVDAGMLGDIYFGRSIWHRRRGMPGFGGWFGQKKLSGGGPLIDLGVHRLDLALWLMGYPRPMYVLGNTYNHLGAERARQEGKEYSVEDLACALIKFENGASLILEASWAAHIKEKELMKTRLLGTKGGLLQYNLDEDYQFEVEFYHEKNGCHFDTKLHDKIAIPEAKGAVYYFTDCIANNRPHMATGNEGIIVMEILDAIYESARTGKPVEIGECSLVK